ncbi:tetraspanin-2-like [Branchiostoma floridae]|uniref:Tetraspanin-2-like n=1 Tax=Branchiostoma floridae TaxID=7739 RepID=A0A9J7MM34_BRAFL|nr:tetraspanin-2-like [Branchiostoma floridae]
MAEGCCGKCSKFMLFVFNLIFWLAGIGLLAFGIWLRLDNDIAKIVSLDLPWFYNATYVLMGVGGFTMIMGFLGCCGAMKENKCMLTTYTICLGLVFIAEIAGGVVAFVYRNNVSGSEQKQQQIVLLHTFDAPFHSLCHIVLSSPQSVNAVIGY